VAGDKRTPVTSTKGHSVYKVQFQARGIGKSYILDPNALCRNDHRPKSIGWKKYITLLALQSWAGPAARQTDQLSHSASSIQVGRAEASSIEMLDMFS
jgi:hypothetical protein